MFTRQRKNYRVFVYTALILTICLLIAALLWPKAQDETQEPGGAEVNAQTESGDGEEMRTPDGEGSGEEEPEPAKEDENGDIAGGQGSYYLVRRDGESIAVFFVEADGRETKLEDTGILYELLPPDDQASFDEGVRIADQEELSTLLQDFGS